MEVYTPAEIARAAGVPLGDVHALIVSGEIPTVTVPDVRTASLRHRFVLEPDAITAVRRLHVSAHIDAAEAALKGCATTVCETPTVYETTTVHEMHGPRELLALPTRRTNPRLVPAGLTAAAAHAAVAGMVLLLSNVASGGSDLAALPDDAARKPARLVYLISLPGPGGGGGGGGLHEPAPPPAAQLKGDEPPKVPLLVRHVAKQLPFAPTVIPSPPRRIEIQKLSPPPAPALRATQLPSVVAPVVSAASDARDRVGLLEGGTSSTDSHGPGSGGGVGSGDGVGVGPGEGPGLGPGSGGGTGGGDYGSGSGVEPPEILKEIKPNYTDEGRRRGIEGDVVLTVVVRRDGTVGEVRVARGLGAGLDQRAMDAVRQWRFSPSRVRGVPVDVAVEVAVEFKLR